jgi:hypothetical protein
MKLQQAGFLSTDLVSAVFEEGDFNIIWGGDAVWGVGQKANSDDTVISKIYNDGTEYKLGESFPINTNYNFYGATDPKTHRFYTALNNFSQSGSSVEIGVFDLHPPFNQLGSIKFPELTGFVADMTVGYFYEKKMLFGFTRDPAFFFMEIENSPTTDPVKGFIPFDGDPPPVETVISSYAKKGCVYAITSGFLCIDIEGSRVIPYPSSILSGAYSNDIVIDAGRSKAYAMLGGAQKTFLQPFTLPDDPFAGSPVPLGKPINIGSLDTFEVGIELLIDKARGLVYSICGNTINVIETRTDSVAATATMPKNEIGDGALRECFDGVNRLLYCVADKPVESSLKGTVLIYQTIG